jgi:hypothetical protein
MLHNFHFETRTNSTSWISFEVSVLSFNWRANCFTYIPPQSVSIHVCYHFYSSPLRSILIASDCFNSVRSFVVKHYWFDAVLHRVSPSSSWTTECGVSHFSACREIDTVRYLKTFRLKNFKCFLLYESYLLALKKSFDTVKWFMVWVGIITPCDTVYSPSSIQENGHSIYAWYLYFNCFFCPFAGGSSYSVKLVTQTAHSDWFMGSFSRDFKRVHTKKIKSMYKKHWFTSANNFRLRLLRRSFKFKRELSSFEHKSSCMNVHALTSYDLFKLAVCTSRAPLHLNHQVQWKWQNKSAQQCRAVFNYQISHEGRCHSFWNLQAQFGDECLSQLRMLSWAKSFRERRTCVENEPHTGRPRTSVNPDNVLKIGEIIRANRRITLLELSQEVGISVGGVE